jgi:hypothetical protein
MKARNPTTGLVPDCCTNSGSAVQPVFKYDAIRTPWRMAWAYCWYGHDTAKIVSSTIASWIATKTGGDPTKIGDGYSLDGTASSNYNNGTFVGCFASAGMVDAKHQTWLDAAYKRLDSLVAQKEVYFSQSLKLLNLLFMSGNMPDFWDDPVSIGSPEYSGNAGKPLKNPLFSWDIRNGVLSLTGVQGGYTIDIFNSSGRPAAKPYYGRSEGGMVNLSLAKRLQPGVYWARLNSATIKTATRVIIAR